MTSGVGRGLGQPLDADDFQVVPGNRVAVSGYEDVVASLKAAGRMQGTQEASLEVVAQIAAKQLCEQKQQWKEEKAEWRSEIRALSGDLAELRAQLVQQKRDNEIRDQDLAAERKVTRDLQSRNEALGEFLREVQTGYQEQMAAANQKVSRLENGHTGRADDPRLKDIGLQDPTAWAVGLTSLVGGAVSSFFAFKTGNVGLALFGGAFTLGGTNLTVPLALTETDARIAQLQKQGASHGS